MIAFLDVNTIWRRKFAAALHRRVAGTVCVIPHPGRAAAVEPGEVAVRVPRGWAGPLAWLAMPLLWRRIRRIVGGAPHAVVVTTPHYLPLARRAARRSAIVYYCSDDYRSYAGWDTARMIRDERALCRLATLSIFVSAALRTRAVTEYGLDPARSLVSPNATEPRFAVAPRRPPEIATLAGPIFGVAGVISTRIDLAFLVAIAADPRVASLALVGPVEAEVEHDPLLDRLRADSKVHFFGARPHATMPAWMGAFDVAVIPYAATAFNHFCSPMRLYDHRAIGQPILATPHCDQIAARPDVLSGLAADLPALIGKAIEAAQAGRRPHVETWDDRIEALENSAVARPLFAQ